MHPEFRYYDSDRTPREPFIRYARVIAPDAFAQPEGYLYEPESADRLTAWENDEWRFVSVRARAEIHIPHAYGKGWTTYEVMSAGIHGVESDAGEDYHAMLYGEEIDSLKSDLKDFAVAIAMAA